MRETLKQYKNLICLALGILLVLTLVVNVHVIPTGYTGVRVRFGLISDIPVQSGRLLVTMPFAEQIHTVNNKQQDYRVESRIWGETDDKTPVYADGVVVTYQISSERSAWIYANVSNYTKSLVTESLVASAVKSGMVKLNPENVTNRSMIEPLVMAMLQASLDGKYGEDTVHVCKVTIADMDFESAYNDAIQARSIAAQQQAQAQIENETSVARAEAEKRVAILNAEAQAEQIRIAAEAEAEANRQIRESLTGDLLTLKKIEAWDGRLPTVVGSETLIGLRETE